VRFTKYILISKIENNNLQNTYTQD